MLKKWNCYCQVKNSSVFICIMDETFTSMEGSVIIMNKDFAGSSNSSNGGSHLPMRCTVKFNNLGTVVVYYLWTEQHFIFLLMFFPFISPCLAKRRSYSSSARLFQQTGMAHLLAIIGLHIALIYGLFYYLFKSLLHFIFEND